MAVSGTACLGRIAAAQVGLRSSNGCSAVKLQSSIVVVITVKSYEIDVNSRDGMHRHMCVCA